MNEIRIVQTPLNQRGPAASASIPTSIVGEPGEVNRQQVVCFFPFASHAWLGAAHGAGRRARGVPAVPSLHLA